MIANTFSFSPSDCSLEPINWIPINLGMSGTQAGTQGGNLRLLINKEDCLEDDCLEITFPVEVLAFLSSNVYPWRRKSNVGIIQTQTLK